MIKRPEIIILTGPDGAGKTTAAPELLQESLGVANFVNADVIASGLSGFSPETVSFRFIEFLQPVPACRR
ncbi:hypothetical protein ACFLQJ_00620 [Calditrichota bacterium]